MPEELRSCSAYKLTLQREPRELDEAGIEIHLTTKKGEKFEFTMTLAKAHDFALDLSGLTGVKLAGQ